MMTEEQEYSQNINYTVFNMLLYYFNEVASKRYSGHSVLLQRAVQPPSPELQLSNFPGTWKGNAC